VLDFATALAQVCLQEGLISAQVAQLAQTSMSAQATPGVSPLGNISQLTYLPSATDQGAQSPFVTSPAPSAPANPSVQLSFMKSPLSQGLQVHAAETMMDPQASQLTFVKTSQPFTPTPMPTPTPATGQSVQWPTHAAPPVAPSSQLGWPQMSSQANLTQAAPLPSGQPGIGTQMMNNTQFAPPSQAGMPPFAQQPQPYNMSSAPSTFANQPFMTPPSADNNSADIIKAMRQASHTNKLLVVVSILLVCVLLVGGTGIWYFSHTRQVPNPPPTANDRSHGTVVAKATAAAPGATATTPATAAVATPTVGAAPTPAVTATTAATQQANPYAPAMGTLAFNDPLSSNQQNWDQTAGCSFPGGAYHVVEAAGQAIVCYAKSTNYTNFTYEVQMTFVKAAQPSDMGGIEFRGNSATGASYRIEVGADGKYSFLVCTTSTVCAVPAGAPPQPQPVPSFRPGANTLAVVANGPTMTFYVNGQPVGAPAQDTTTIQGMIGVYGQAGAAGGGIDVAYNNARVWQ